MADKKLLIVDISALAFRSHFAFINRPLTRNDGMVTSALFGTANTLVSMIQKYKPTHVVCARDTGKKTFRNEIYAEYKAHRPPCPPELAPQLDLMGKLCEAFSIKPVMVEGYEADDIIGAYALQGKKEGVEVYILSSDKDFMQLLQPGIRMLIHEKGGEYNEFFDTDVPDKMGVEASQILDFLSLMGDSADNIPGAPGVGKVTAAKLLKEHQTLENMIEAIPSMKKSKMKEKLEQNVDLIHLSKRLVTIKTDIPELPSIDNLEFSGFKMDVLKPFIAEMEFPKILSRLEKKVEEKKKANNFISLGAQFKALESFEEVDQLKLLIASSESLWVYPHFEGDELLGIALSRRDLHAVYIPDSLYEENFEDKLCELLKDFKGTLMGYDLKALMRFFQKQNLTLNKVVDAYLLATVVFPGKPFHDFSKFCDAADKYELYAFPKKGNKNLPFSEQELSAQKNFCCDRVVTMQRYYPQLWQQCQDLELEEVFQLEMDLLPVIATMENNGICLDVDTINRYADVAGKELDELTAEIQGIAGEEFNVRSTQQLGVILFEKLMVQDQVGLKKVKKTKTGYSTDNSVLEKIKSLPIGKALLRHRHLTKLKSGYLDSLPKEVNEKTGRIHTHYLQNGTSTGRLSSHAPNLQNIPMRSEDGARIRESFIPSKEGNVLIGADYSQIELRVLTHFCEDEVLIDTFRNNLDVHAATAAKVFGVALEDVDRNQRSGAKAVNFGLLYGMGPRHLAEETGMAFGDAQKFIKQYFETFPKVDHFLKEQVNQARQDGYVTTLAGRKRYLPDLESSNGMLKNAAENMALNTPIQGSAADLIKWAMIRIQKRIEAENLPLKMLLQVHDELIFECPKDYESEMKNLIISEMEDASKLPHKFTVPLKVQAEAGTSWREIH